MFLASLALMAVGACGLPDFGTLSATVGQFVSDANVPVPSLGVRLGTLDIEPNDSILLFDDEDTALYDTIYFMVRNDGSNLLTFEQVVPPVDPGESGSLILETQHADFLEHDSPPESPLDAGDDASFFVRLLSGSDTERTAKILIYTNDPVNYPFEFEIRVPARTFP